MSANPAPLDLSVLDELKDILEEGLTELLEEYLNSAPSQLQALEKEVEKNNLSGIATLSHSLKGSSGNLGIAGMYQLCLALEQEAKSGQLDDAKERMTAISEAFEQAKEELGRYMADI